MRTYRPALLLLLPVALLCHGCASSSRPVLPSPGARSDAAGSRVGQFFEEYFNTYLQFDPLLASQIGETSYNDQLAIDISEEYRTQIGHFYQRYLEKLARLDTSGINERDRISCQVLRRELTRSLDGLRYPTHLLPIDQLGSLAVRFPLLGSGADVHPFRVPGDYDDFVARAYAFGVWVDTAIANMRRGMELGVVQARPVIERTLPQLEAQIVDDPTTSVFYTPIRQMPQSFSDAQRTRLADAYRRMIAEQIVPTYRRLVEFLRSEYLPKCRDRAGMSALPGGDAWYEYLVRFYTTSEMPIDSLFLRGMAESERIQKARQAIFARVGATSDFEFRQKVLEHYPLYGTRDSLVAAYTLLKGRVERALPILFTRIPRADFEVRAVEEYREASFPSHYVPPPPDGSRPGIFYVNAGRTATAPQPVVESLFLHEAIPGHHLQLALQVEQTMLPTFRRFGYYGAFIEGWGLYAESLGSDLGLYTDIFQSYLRLGAELGRAKRLVVDIGLHRKGWSRSEAIDFLMRGGGMERAQAEAEVDRYIAMPGQALSYKVGEMEINELKTRAQRALGEDFDLRAFHDELLGDGALPLDLVEQKIEAWIGRQAETQ